MCCDKAWTPWICCRHVIWYLFFGLLNFSEVIKKMWFVPAHMQNYKFTTTMHIYFDDKELTINCFLLQHKGMTRCHRYGPDSKSMILFYPAGRKHDEPVSFLLHCSIFSVFYSTVPKQKKKEIRSRGGSRMKLYSRRGKNDELISFAFALTSMLVI